MLAPELGGKRQEILIDMVPTAQPQRIAALADSNTTAPPLQSLHRYKTRRIRGASSCRYTWSVARGDCRHHPRGTGLQEPEPYKLTSPLLIAQRQIILERTAASHLPAIYQWPETVREGGLAAYGPRIVQLSRDVLARQFVKLLRGADLANLPVEQPTKFELVINLQAAKALGLTTLQSILARADEVID